MFTVTFDTSSKSHPSNFSSRATICSIVSGKRLLEVVRSSGRAQVMLLYLGGGRLLSGVALGGEARVLSGVALLQLAETTAAEASARRGLSEARHILCCCIACCCCCHANATCVSV